MPKKLNAFHLKLIAVIAMLLNHIGHAFDMSQSYPVFYFFTEIIGKLTFPIMAFLLVEGFHHTRSRKKYALRLAVFWLLSVVPFYLLFYSGRQPFTFFELFNNVLFTLLMGLLMMICSEKTSNAALQVFIVIFFALSTLYSDWAILGILIINGFYRIKNPKTRIIAPMLYIGLPASLMMALGNFTDPAERALSASLYVALPMLIGLLLNIPLLLSYNGERGYSPPWVKWGYYVFYPLHLALLILIRFIIS